MKKIALAAVTGGLILFVWTALSWMALPFHTMNLNSIPDEDNAIAALGEYVTESGVYQYPGMGPDQALVAEKLSKGPRLFMLFRTDGADMMDPMQFVRGLILNIIVAGLIAFLLSKAVFSLPTYGSRILFVTLFSLLPVFHVEFAMANWWGFPLDYILVNVFDHVAGFALAGLAIAWFIKPE